MGKGELAEELFLKGYNCAQAVAGAFAEDIGMDFDTAVKTVSSFGGGMGRLREVCGAVSGMFFVAGALYGYSDPKDYAAKKEHYERIRYLAEKFKEQTGSIVCRYCGSSEADGRILSEAAVSQDGVSCRRYYGNI